MRDSLVIGSSPPAEDCAQLGQPDYTAKARRECWAYIALLRRTVGQEPPEARLFVQSCPHDFGTYLTVSCAFDDSDEAAADYAFRCEGEGPQVWDDQARRELGLEQSDRGPKEKTL